MSLLSDIAIPLAKLTNMKKLNERAMENPRRDIDFFNRKYFDRSLQTEEEFIEDFQVLTVKSEKSSDRHVIFLHGGGYTLKAFRSHRIIVERMVKKYGLKVTFIDYPLTPENTAEKTYEILRRAYCMITEKNKNDVFCFFGDSAGGGLALGFIQELRDRSISPFPVKTVLMSPWVDISLTNKEIEEFEERDPLLPLNTLMKIGRKYAGNMELENPLVSPVYGNMNNLGHIFLIFGTNEIFYPDCMKLDRKLSEAFNTEKELFIGENLCHDWILAPLKETDATLDRIGEFFLK